MYTGFSARILVLHVTILFMGICYRFLTVAGYVPCCMYIYLPYVDEANVSFNVTVVMF